MTSDSLEDKEVASRWVTEGLEARGLVCDLEWANANKRPGMVGEEKDVVCFYSSVNRWLASLMTALRRRAL